MKIFIGDRKDWKHAFQNYYHDLTKRDNCENKIIIKLNYLNKYN